MRGLQAAGMILATSAWLAMPCTAQLRGPFGGTSSYGPPYDSYNPQGFYPSGQSFYRSGPAPASSVYSPGSAAAGPVNAWGTPSNAGSIGGGRFANYSTSSTGQPTSTVAGMPQGTVYYPAVPSPNYGHSSAFPQQAFASTSTATPIGQPITGAGLPSSAPMTYPFGDAFGSAAPSTFSGSFMSGLNGPWDGPSCCPSPCCPTPCGGPVTCPVCPRWFGGVYGLIMEREDSDPVCFLVDPAIPSETYFSSRLAEMNTAGGVEVHFGRTLCNCRLGLEFVYWGLFPEDQFATFDINDVTATSVWTTQDLRDVYLNFDDPTSGPFTDSIHNQFNDPLCGCPILAARMERSFEYQNGEVNFLSGPLYAGNFGFGGCGGCGPSACGPGYGVGCGGMGACGLGDCAPCCPPRMMIGWLMGFRYFRIDEGLSVAFDNDTGLFITPDGYFREDIETRNNLYGLQLGCLMDYCITPRFQLIAGSKFGVFGNHMNQYFNIYNGLGSAFVDPANPAGSEIDIASTRDDIAFLGELQAGLGYRIGCHWRLTGGYRLLAASNVALPLSQLPVGRTYGDLYKLSSIDNDDSLILHGAYFGGEFAW